MTQDIRVRSWSLGGPLGGWWALALRAIVGYGFMAHGFAKLSRGPSAFAGVLHALGVPAPDVMAWAVNEATSHASCRGFCQYAFKT